MGKKKHRVSLGLEIPSGHPLELDNEIETEIELSDEEVARVIEMGIKEIWEETLPDYESYEWKGMEMAIEGIRERARQAVETAIKEKYGEESAKDITVEDVWIPEEIEKAIYESEEMKRWEESRERMRETYDKRIHVDRQIIDEGKTDRWVQDGDSQDIIGSKGGIEGKYWYKCESAKESKLKAQYLKHMKVGESRIEFRVEGTEEVVREAIGKWYKENGFAQRHGDRYEKEAQDDDGDPELFLELLRVIGTATESKEKQEER